MVPALLLLAAAATSPQPGVRLQALATARIVSGERVTFEAAVPPPSAQRRRILPRGSASDNSQAELRLVEFQ